MSHFHTLINNLFISEQKIQYELWKVCIDQSIGWNQTVEDEKNDFIGF